MLDQVLESRLNVVQGSDGITRRAFSADDVRRMLEAGIMNEDEPFELIDGELVFMNAKGFAHDRIKTALARKLGRFLPDSYFVGAEVSVQLSTRNIVQPDLVVGPDSAVVQTPEGFLTIPAADIMLIVEVAATSLSVDRGRKASLYAREGVSEYWIIDAKGRRGWMHRDPAPDGFQSITAVGETDELRPAAGLSGFAIRIADLG